MKRWKIAFLSTTLLVLGMGFSAAFHPPTAFSGERVSVKTVHVTVDLGSPIPAKNMAGFMGVISQEGFPSMNTILRKLNPHLIRGELGEAMILRDLVRRHEWEEHLSKENDLWKAIEEGGGRYVFVLSNFWGYPRTGWKLWGVRKVLRKTKGPPYKNWREWEAIVADVAEIALQKLPPQRVIFEVWNEPTADVFWEGGQEAFFETYLRAERTIHELYPRALVAGPCYAGIFDPDRIRAFLEFCLKKGCEVNVLTWHENQIREKPWWHRYPKGHIDHNEIGDTRVISRHLQYAREEFLENPRYRPLKIKEILITEYTDRFDRYRPGEAVSYLWALEEGRADGAVRTCWLPDPHATYREGDCGNNSLNGLLLKGHPRPVYWIYRAYGAGWRSRVLSRTTEPEIVALGSTESSFPHVRAQVLIGYQKIRNEDKGPLWITVTLEDVQGLLDTPQLFYTVMGIPSEEGTLSHPVVRRTGMVTMRGDKIEIEAGVLEPHAAMLVVLHDTARFSLEGDFPQSSSVQNRP